MHSFEIGSRTWRVAVNVATVKRVRQALDFNLLDLAGGAAVLRLFSDPVLLVDVLYVLCKPQADAEGVSDEDFGRAMAGDAIKHATKALLDELVDFQPHEGDRRNLRKALEALDRGMEAMQTATASRLAAAAVTAAVQGEKPAEE